MVRVTVILILAVLHAAFGVPPFLTDGGYAVRALSYPFFHASWWHLAVNAIAVWMVYDPRRCRTWRDILVPYVISCLVYPLSLRPVIGFSNVLYAVLGLRTPPLSSPWWKKPAVLTFIAITVAMVFIPRFSATTHIAAFLLGMAGASAGRGWKRITEDADRYLR